MVGSIDKSIKMMCTKFEVIWIKTDWDIMHTIRPKNSLSRKHVSGKSTLNVFFSIFVDKFYFFGKLCWKIFEKCLNFSSIVWLLVNYMSKISPSKHDCLLCCIKSLFYWIFPSLFHMLQNDIFSLFPRFEKKKSKYLEKSDWDNFFCYR